MWVKIQDVKGNAIEVDNKDGKGPSQRIYDSASKLVGFEGCTMWGTVPTGVSAAFAIDAHVRLYWGVGWGRICLFGLSV